METGNELEQMRGQLGMLKEKLNQQKIISDRLLQTSIRQLSQESSRPFTVSLVLMVVIIPFCWVMFGRMGLSVLFRIVTAVWIVAGNVYGYFYRRHLQGLAQADLLTAGSRMALIIRMSGLYRNIFTLTFLGWIAWFCIELYDRTAAWPPMLAGGGACLAGVIAGYVMNRRQQKRFETLREEVDRLTRE